MTNTLLAHLKVAEGPQVLGKGGEKGGADIGMEGGKAVRLSEICVPLEEGGSATIPDPAALHPPGG